MPTITGVCRHQISILSLDSQITNDNEIRFIDAFVGELALIMTVYNIKRTKKILGFDKLMEFLKNWTPNYPEDSCSSQNRLHLNLLKPFNFSAQNIAA